ncbi:hypothetical protein [Frankia sp. CiP3]|uniref:hypothetical protein n=1 Tax=Frankia sp. CiP3 TaxID=2880971 RepID=UPI001EF4B1C8|nr:hypothetical protein [Frankia sp. CiP3]
MLKLALSTAVIVLPIVLIATAVPVRADGGFGDAVCSRETAGCDLWAGTDISGRERPSGEEKPLRRAGDGNTRSVNTCTVQGVAGLVLCVDPALGWLADDGCYYRAAVDFVPSSALEAREATAGVAGSWYDTECLGVSTGSGVVWRPDTEMATVPPSAQVMAQLAWSRLSLPRPVIGASPPVGAVQLLGVPVWLWIDPALWVPVSATAAVSGVAVTARAVPVSVIWDFGVDGRVVCSGPGSPFRLGIDEPAAVSPSCGHTFTRSSAGQPDDRFRVTVTVTWAVTWAGAGQTGVFPPGLTSQTVTTMAVAESQAVTVLGQPVGR